MHTTATPSPTHAHLEHARARALVGGVHRAQATARGGCCVALEHDDGIVVL
jgi:hypothetical protein